MSKFNPDAPPRPSAVVEFFEGPKGPAGTAGAPGVTSGIYRGAWVTGTAYKANDMVTSSGQTYAATNDHTAGATFAGDLSAHWLSLVESTRVDISSKGARSDGLRISDAAITAAAAVLTSATASFNLFDVGKAILVEGAGASGGTLQSTIQSLTNGTTVVLTANAGTTVSGARAEYGTDDKAAIDAALTASAALGVPAYIPGDRITFSSGGHAGIPGTDLVGAGQANTFVRHIGNNVFYKYTEGGASPNGTKAGGARDFTLRGNPGASAVGIQISDAFGAKLRRILVGGRPITGTGRGDFDCYNGGGVAWLLQNETFWTEGTVLDECGSMFNDVAWRFQNHLNADPTKNNSFAYTKTSKCFMQVPTNGTGLDFGGPDDNPILTYNAQLDFHIWGSQGPNQINNVSILVRKNAQIPHLTKAEIKGEVIGGIGNIWIRNIGDGSNGGRFNPSGHVRVYRDAGCTDDLQAGSETAPPLAGGVALALDPSAAVPGMVGHQDSGTGAWKQNHAVSGATQKANEEAWYTGGYSFTGAPIHRFIALTLNAHKRGPFNVDSFLKSWVRADGAYAIGSITDPRIIAQRSGADPEGSVVGSRGDTFSRTLNTGKVWYVKTQGDATNTGWVNHTIIKGSASWDPPSVADGAVSATKTVTVVGAAIGDIVLPPSFVDGSAAAVPAGVFLTGVVTAADTVSVTLHNRSGSVYDGSAGTLNARVLKLT